MTVSKSKLKEKGKPKMKNTIEKLAKKWERPIRKIIEVVRIDGNDEYVEETIPNAEENFTLRDAASYARDIYEQYRPNVDRVDFKKREIMPLEKCEEEIILLVQCERLDELDEDDSEGDFVSERQMLLEKRKELDELELDEDDFKDVLVSEIPVQCEGNEDRNYLYNVDEKEDLYNIDETVLYLMKEGRLIDIENKEIQNKIVTIKDVKGKTRKLVYTWNKEKKEYRARAYPEEDVSDILGKYPDEKKHFYGFGLENWLRKGCLGWL